MAALRDVLFLVLVLAGIAMVFLGVATLKPVREWWARMPERAGLPFAPLSIGIGVVILIIALFVLVWVKNAPEQRDESVTAAGTVSGDIVTAIIAAAT
jgi:hypothetical protein